MMRKIRTEDKSSVLILLTSEPHQYSKAAFEIIGVRPMSIWWRRGELNPRPKALPQELLRAQTILYIPSLRRGSSHY